MKNVKKVFNPWDIHHSNVSNKGKQCFPSKLASEYLGIKLYEDYIPYKNYNSEYLWRCVNKQFDKMYDFYVENYPELKTIYVYDDINKKDLIRGIISKFNIDDIRYYMEYHITGEATFIFKEKYNCILSFIERDLNIRFGYIISPETINLIIDKFKLPYNKIDIEDDDEFEVFKLKIFNEYINIEGILNYTNYLKYMNEYWNYLWLKDNDWENIKSKNIIESNKIIISIIKTVLIDISRDVNWLSDILNNININQPDISTSINIKDLCGIENILFDTMQNINYYGII